MRDGNALRILNVPTINPRVMFAQQSIEDLPLVESDAGYSQKRVELPQTVSYAKRLLFTAWDPGPALWSGRSPEELLQILRGEQATGTAHHEKTGVPFVDTTPCVLEVGPDAGDVPNDTHYSPAGNAAVAKCLGVALNGILPSRAARTRYRTSAGTD